MSISAGNAKPNPLDLILLWLGRILMGLAVLALVFLFVVFVILAINLIQFPFDYDQGEGFELWNAVLFSQGRWIYTDNEVYPFYSSLYGPVYPLLMTPLVALFGPHIAVGRALTFAVTLICGGVIYSIVYRETHDRLMAVIAALLFFASNFVYQIGALCRQHMTMVMFDLLGVALIARAVEESDNRRAHRYIVLSLLCLMLAGFTKPLALAAVLAVFAFLFLRRPKWAILYGIGFGLVVGLVFWLLNVATGGYWVTNMITANTNPFVTGQAELFYRQWFSLHPVITILGFGYVLYTIYLDRISVYSLYYLAAVAFGALSGKWGAGLSYFVDAIVAACIGTGIGLAVLRRWLQSRPRKRRPDQPCWKSIGLTAYGIVVPILLLVQFRANLHMPLDLPLTRPVAALLNIPSESPNRFRQDYFDTVGYTQLGHLTTDADIEAGYQIVEWVESTPGPAWTEEAMLSLLAGKDEVVTDPLVLYNLYQNGNLDVSEMIRMIDAQEFGIVVYRARFYPIPVLQAIEENYGLVDQIEMNGFVYDILLPRTDVD
ncbi:MAG: hypothetical protein JXJ17_09910 [Anaerolineae bacterium]|nr:hypothetical protein [Anaerolineae bacterium]